MPADVRTQLNSKPVLAIVLVAVIVAIGIHEPSVLSQRNLLNILVQAGYLIFFASAQSVVLIARGFDLSVGTAVSVISVASAMAMTALLPLTGSHLAIAAAIVVGLSIGLVIGLFNGILVAILKINPFVATLGTMNICLGIATTISGGVQVFGLPPEWSATFAGTWFGVPASVALALIFIAAIHFLLSRTVFGRRLYLSGDNPRAAVAAGLPVTRTIVIAYIVCSLSAAIGGLLLTARTATGEPNLGGSLALQSIAAAVMGGVPLTGGVGTIASPIFGALLVTILSNWMDLARINGDLQQIVLGLVIVTAVFLDRLRRGRT